MAVAYAQRETMALTLRRLRAVLQDPDYQVPMLPRVALDVMRLSRQKSVSLGRLADVLEQDPMLAASVLKVAQTPAYARRWEPRTVREAVNRLGLRGMRAVVMEAALGAVVFGSGRCQKEALKIQRRCVALGHVSRALGQRPEPRVDPEEAFLAGLLADVGKSAVLALLSDHDVDLDRVRSFELLEELHQDASGVLARAWRLPEELRDVLVSHHSLALLGEPGRLAATVRVAETLIDIADGGKRWDAALLHEGSYQRALRRTGLQEVPLLELAELAEQVILSLR